MRKPFWLIDGKLREADFFLEKLRITMSLEDARFYFSAFVSAARSVTFAVQVCLADTPRFQEWWETQQARLKADPIACYFKNTRDITIHTGLNPLGGQSRGMLRSVFRLMGEDLPESNAARAGWHYMSLLVAIVDQAYSTFWSSLDLAPEMTVSELAHHDRTLEDVENEFGLPTGASSLDGASDEARLQFLKVYSRTAIQGFRSKYASPPDFEAF